MAKVETSPHDFIQQAFAPMVAVLCTPGVDEVCEKNNLNFTQLLKPFSKATVDGLLKDPASNSQVPIRNMRVSFYDIHSVPPPPTVARSYFNFSISSNVKEKTTKIPVGDDFIDIPVSTPWFEAWRDTFFQVQYPSDHEFTKHYIGCLIAISSLDQNPLERLEELYESLQAQINSGPGKFPKWFSTTLILITFIYVHDYSVSKLDVTVFEAMKVTYGINKCFLLCINSGKPEDRSSIVDPWEKYIHSCIEYKEDGKEREIVQGVETAREAGEKSCPSTPDIVHPLSPIGDEESNITKDIISLNTVLPPHGKLLSSEDIDKIKQFINDFCVKALIPHFEQYIHQLSDLISNKKGVSRSLFSATKRWFGSNKPGAPGNHISPTAIAYSNDSHELQLRKLGDLAFMVGHYSLAFNAYHSAKRDFGADGAWLHYAGALEMAALAAYMSNSETLTRKVVEYAEESILTYQNSCRMNQFATRATLLSVECLKGRGLFGEAAKQLIRMSGEDSDLRSAVLLEQAAYCFLSSVRPVMFRKYAFHMVLAGHRFSKAGHKIHSMRCYSQAYQIYGNKAWSVAEDHILYTIGKHASTLQMASKAVDALGLLVSRTSRQSPQQQELYLKDYLSTIEQVEEINFSIPVIDCNLTQVLLGIPNHRHPSGTVSASGFVYSTAEGFQTLSDETVWWNLEEKLVVKANIFGNMLMFKPTIELLTNSTNNSSCTSGFVGEAIGVCVSLKNPLNIQITLQDVCLLWTIIPEAGICQDSSQSHTAAIANSVKEIVLLPDSAKYIMLKIIPNCVGELHITGISYSLFDSISGQKVAGKQPLIIYNKNRLDRRLHICVTEDVPHLDISFSGLKKELVSGEIIPLNIFLKNTGSTPISRILLASSGSFLLASEDDKKTSSIFTIKMDGPLEINETIEKIFYIQPTFKGTTSNLELLFYYESGIVNMKPKYRLSRHSWPTHVYNSVKSDSLCTRSHNSFEEGDQGINIGLRISTNVLDSAVISDIRLETINIISNVWNLKPKVLPSDVTIRRGESLNMLVKAVKDRHKSLSDPVSTFKFSDNTLPLWCNYFIPSPPEITGSPHTDMLCVFTWSADLVSGEVGEDDHTRKAYGLHAVHLTSLDHHLSPVTTDTTAAATTPLIVPKMTILSSLTPDKSDKIKDSLSVKIQHPQKLNHDFTVEKLCIVPVKCSLQNTGTRDLSFVVKASPFPEETTEETNVSYHYIWIGKCTHHLTLSPNAISCITLHAGITASGAFDLSSRLVIEIESLNNIPIVLPKPEAVVMVC